MVVHHALVDDGVTAGLADHEIGPLYDDDGHEEGRVAGVLQNLTLGVRPLLKPTSSYDVGRYGYVTTSGYPLKLYF